MYAITAKVKNKYRSIDLDKFVGIFYGNSVIFTKSALRQSNIIFYLYCLVQRI